MKLNNINQNTNKTQLRQSQSTFKACPVQFPTRLAEDLEKGLITTEQVAALKAYTQSKADQLPASIKGLNILQLGKHISFDVDMQVATGIARPRFAEEGYDTEGIENLHGTFMSEIESLFSRLNRAVIKERN